jgi:hypothetical protein
VALIEEENLNAPVSIHLKVDGPVFAEGIPLHLLTGTLFEFQAILDKTYLGLSGKRRLTKEDRSHFYVLSPGIKHSSIEADLGLVLTGVQTAFPFFSSLGPKGIWEYTKQTYEFLKQVYEAMHKGKQPTYSWSGDNSQFQVNTGTQNNVYNGPVFNIGQMSVAHYHALSKPVQEKSITSYNFGDASIGSVGFGTREADLFSLPSLVEDIPIKFRGEIFDFNKFENVGKLHIGENESIKEGDYRFDVIGKQDVSVYIEAMLRKQVTITCLREISPNPFSPEKIVRFQVISVEP